MKIIRRFKNEDKIAREKLVYHNMKKKKENATENVASMVMHVYPDSNISNDNNYINFSVNNSDAEDATVASTVMQRSEKPCLSRLLGSTPISSSDFQYNNQDTKVKTLGCGESSALSKRYYINKWKCFSFNGNDRKRETNFNFLSLIFISLLMILLLAPGVLSLGITPGRTTLNYEAGLEKEIEFSVLNNEHKNLQVMLIVQGELNGSVTLYNGLVEFMPSEESKQFKYKFKVPDGIEKIPGLHAAEIIALEIPKASATGSYVGATVAVSSQLHLNVPYPGKYVDADLNVLDAESNGTATFIIPLINRGKVGIGEARAVIDIYTSLNEKIDSVETDYYPIEPGARTELTGKWNIKVPSGNYLAKVTVFYDSESRSFEKQFAVGTQALSIESILVNNFRLGEIAKLQILVENKWNQELKSVFANLLVYNNEDQIMADLKSATENIPALSKKELIAYWDTVGVKEGEYNGKLMVKHGEKSSDKNLILKVSENNLDIVGVGYAIRPQGSSKGTSLTTILLILVILMLIVNLAWFVFFKRMMGKKK